MAPPSIPTVCMYVRLILLHLLFLLHFGGGGEKGRLWILAFIAPSDASHARWASPFTHHHSPRGPRAFEEEEIRAPPSSHTHQYLRSPHLTWRESRRPQVVPAAS
jgi:hypothetical protein